MRAVVAVLVILSATPAFAESSHRKPRFYRLDHLLRKFAHAARHTHVFVAKTSPPLAQR
jgi:hypothetical protein